MSSETEALARRASRERERLSAALEALEEEIGALADWRGYVRRQPALLLGLAALGGVMLGAATATRRRPATTARRAGRRVIETGEAVAGSALSAFLLRRAGGMLMDFVSDRALSAIRTPGAPESGSARGERTRPAARGERHRS